jgi:hypothetical protein
MQICAITVECAYFHRNWVCGYYYLFSYGLVVGVGHCYMAVECVLFHIQSIVFAARIADISIATGRRAQHSNCSSNSDMCNLYLALVEY